MQVIPLYCFAVEQQTCSTFTQQKVSLLDPKFGVEFNELSLNVETFSPL